MEELKSYAEPQNLANLGPLAGATTAAADKPASALEDLQGVQGETIQLLDILESRLRVVSEGSPSDEAKGQSDFKHILQALDNQYAINRKIRQLINELKV